MNISIEENMIEKGECPQSAEMWTRRIYMLADLWHTPEHENPVGRSTIGSSQACMLAGMATKLRYQLRRDAEGKQADGRTSSADRSR